MNASALIWHNGRLKPWQEATVHVGAHALHYGSSVFEGLRVYETPQGSRYFRLKDHTERLLLSLTHRDLIRMDPVLKNDICKISAVEMFRNAQP